VKRNLFPVGLFAAIFLVGCDPGITIRQSTPAADSESYSGPMKERLTIAVEPSNHLIGETWYVSKFEITNSFREQITVTDAQLMALGVTYSNQLRTAQDIYPAVIQPDHKQILGAKFDLQTDVKTAFSQPVQLRVIFTIGQKREVATIMLTGR